MKRQYRWAGDTFDSLEAVKKRIEEKIGNLLRAMDGELVHRVTGDSWHAVKEVDVKITLRGH